MRKAVIYTRVSTGKENQQQSYDNQRDYYIGWCEKNNYELVHIYPEKGLTGTNARRPEFIQLMYDAGLDHQKNENGYDQFIKTDRKPKFNYIVCKDVSRFSRSQQIGMTTIEYLRDKGVYVIFENTGLNTQDDDWHMRASIMFTMAQNESHNTSRRIQFTKRFNAEKGKYKPSRLPFGYKRNENKEIVIDEEQAKIVKFIFDSYENEGSHILTKKLNDMNISTQRGTKWSGDKITRIISNRIYTGTAMVGRQRKENVTDVKSAKIDKDKWLEVPNAVPPIISVEQWKKMNEIRESRINRSSKRGRKPANNDPYFEKIYCKECGSRFVRHMGHKEKINYMCQSRRNNGTCNVRGIAVNIINKLMDQTNINQLSNEMGNQNYYNILTKRLNTELGKLQQRKDQLTAEIVQLKNKNDNWIIALEEKLANSPQSVIDTITKKMDLNDQAIEDLKNQREKININTVKNLIRKVEEKQKLINSIVSTKKITKKDKMKLLKKITVGDYDVEIQFTLPNFQDEIKEFNEVFKIDPIKTQLSFRSFNKTYRREHKEARDYWKIVDEEAMEQQDFFKDNPTIY